MLRRLSQTAFLVLFLALFFMTQGDSGDSAKYTVEWFQDFDPLILAVTLLVAGWIPKVLLLSIVLVALTAIFGRVFCGWICPMGTLAGMVPSIQKKKAADSRWPYRIKYYVLLLMLAAAVCGVNLSGFLDPLSILARTFTTTLFPLLSLGADAAANLAERGPVSVATAVGNANGWLRGAVFPASQQSFDQSAAISVLFAAILALGLLRGRFWCRFLCPLGALLGLISAFAPFRVKAGEGCVSCNACAKSCAGGAVTDNGAGRQTAECIECLECTKKCPKDVVDYGRSGAVSTPDLGRRDVVASMVAGAVTAPVVALVGRGKNPNLIRPPGSVAEPGFLDLCMKCGACMKVCPTGGLQPAFMEAGLEGLWTPRLVPVVGACEYCTLCGQ
ncbi:MAG: 4Fe-4S binding protein, partial [Myxococcota bacterium]